MKEWETEGRRRERERDEGGGGERQVGERAGEGGGIGTYRNLPNSVVVQGAEGQLGRNCSRCGQVACWFARPSGAHLGGSAVCQGSC